MRPSLAGENTLGDGDLLLAAGLAGRGGVFLAAVGVPGARRELQATVVAVAGVDSPVAAGLALCEAVPVGVGGGSGRAAERDTRDAEDCARQRELRDGTTGIGGLAMASAHVGSVFLSVRTYEVSCRVRAEEVARPCRSVGSAFGFTPRTVAVASARASWTPSGCGPIGSWETGGSPVSCPLWIVRRDFRNHGTGIWRGGSGPVEPGGSTGHDGNGSEGEVSPIDNAPIRVATDVRGADQGMKSQVVGSGYPEFRFESRSLSARYVRKITCNSGGHPQERSPSPGASGRSGSSSGSRRRAGCR